MDFREALATGVGTLGEFGLRVFRVITHADLVNGWCTGVRRRNEVNGRGAEATRRILNDGFTVNGSAKRTAHMYIIKGRLTVVEAQVVDADAVDEQQLIFKVSVGLQALGFFGWQAAGTHHINLPVQIGRKQCAGIVDDQDLNTVNIAGAAQIGWHKWVLY